MVWRPHGPDPAAELRACLKTPLGLDAAMNSDHSNGALATAGEPVGTEL